MYNTKLSFAVKFFYTNSRQKIYNISIYAFSLYIVFDKYSFHILVNGKTGSRRIRLSPAATIALTAWLDVHPNKDHDAPVWVNIQIRKEIPRTHLSYDWAHKMLKDLAKRAGIAKPIRPHLLRHSLATYYAPKLTEAVMNEHFGWRQGGRTASIYTHLSGKQVDEQILAIYNCKRIDPQSNKVLDVIICRRCSLQNSPASIQCSKCGFPLTEDAATELIHKRNKAEELMNQLMRHPEVVNVLKKVAEEAITETQSQRSKSHVPPFGNSYCES